MTINHLLSDQEFIVVIDDDNWVWSFVKNTLTSLSQKYIKISSDTSLRNNWSRFSEANKIIIYWENLKRNGGSIVEEILEINPIYDVSNKIIVLTTHPQHEDVIYFNELNIKKIIILRQKIDVLEKSTKEFIKYLQQNFTSNPTELLWQDIQNTINKIKYKKLGVEHLSIVENKLNSFSDKQKNTARYYDIVAQISFLRQNFQQAEMLWKKALEFNPNYYKTYSNLIEYYISVQKFDIAVELLHKLHALNKKGIFHLVQLGEIYLKKEEIAKAEHYFQEVLEKDKYCSRALNGLAIIKFQSGNLQEAKDLIARSSMIENFASTLNQIGINLVKQKQYAQALDLYTKAQYVVPNKIKSSMLFYNIGLCYLKWNKEELAKKFLNLALTKEPHYQKALNLLAKIDNNK